MRTARRAACVSLVVLVAAAPAVAQAKRPLSFVDGVIYFTAADVKTPEVRESASLQVERR
jgi:hypothetical protein